VRAGMRRPGGGPSGVAADPGTTVSVLADAVAGTPDGPRLGARLYPLRPWMARRHGVVGAEVALTARLLGHLPTGPAVVIVVAPGVAASAAAAPLPPVVAGMLAPGPMTVGVASPGPVRSATAGTLTMYNVHLDALPEALVEAIAAARRCGLVTALGNVVLLAQTFVPAAASAVVLASPDRRVPVRIDGRWGLTETGSPADSFEVAADGAVAATLVRKPDAQVAACGGTRTVRVPASRCDRYSLDRATVRRLATFARAAAVTAGRPLVLDVVLREREPVVLRCRLTRA
jgi:hypothetical protein